MSSTPRPVPDRREEPDARVVGTIVHEYYSGTEDIGATWITAEEWLAHPGSVGRPMSPAHIVGPDGNELPTGQDGSSTSKAADRSSITTIRKRQPRLPTIRVGVRSATSDCWTRTGTSI